MLTEFKEKAAQVSSTIHEVATLQRALERAVRICETGTPSDDASTSSPKLLVAPDLDSGQRTVLERLCRDAGITLVNDSMRNHGSGVDVGITFADYGIAETGTLVVSSDSEEKRLAGMLSEVHVALLPLSRICPTALAITEELKALTAKPSSYMAFITGPSRTADIERVLAIGVHGPLELHVILYGDPSEENESQEAIEGGETRTKPEEQGEATEA